MNRLLIVGTGSGMPDYILPCAKKALECADYVIASARIAEGLGLKNAYSFSGIDETLSLCRELLQKGETAVAVSGDPLMYSFLKTVQRELADVEICVIPSVGALQLMGARFGITLEDAKIVSVHGREMSDAAIVRAVCENKKVFFFCDSVHTPSYIARILCENRLGGARMCVGANLTYESEIAEDMTVRDISDKAYPALAMVAVINENAREMTRGAPLRDSEFERTDAPMTKEEVRAVVMLKLGVGAESVVWDIGAGTGSVSVECARSAVFGEVYSVEKNPDAVRALELNKNKFGLDNMVIIPENAAPAVSKLPEPDIVFIGGTGGELSEVFGYLTSIQKRVRVVMTAVTLETKSAAYELMKTLDGFDAVEMSVSRARSVGRYTVMEPNNQVMILSGYTKAWSEEFE